MLLLKLKHHYLDISNRCLLLFFRIQKIIMYIYYAITLQSKNNYHK